MTSDKATIYTYISQFPKDVQTLLLSLRKVIQELAPEAEEVLCYGVPTFKLHGKNLVHYAAFKKHIGFYPSPSAIVAFGKELSSYETAKGTIRFPFDTDLPFDLVGKIVKYRIKEIG